jgi:hypothetical protein
VQLIWLVIVLFVLPIDRRTSRGSDPNLPDTTGGQARPQHGSVPVSALLAKVILPPSSDKAFPARAADQPGA